MENDDRKRFNEELASFYNAIPQNAELLSGQDVNANISIQSRTLNDAIGTHGLDNRNAKGKDLLFLLKSIKCRVLLIYFKHRNCTTWRSFNSTRYPHMLDNFICSRPFFCWVKDWKLVNIGMRSNHTAILTTFIFTSIKFKMTENIWAKTNRKLIGYHNMNNELFNNRLSMSITDSTTYSNYNKYILEADINNATKNNHKNKGWFNFSRD